MPKHKKQKHKRVKPYSITVVQIGTKAKLKGLLYSTTDSSIIIISPYYYKKKNKVIDANKTTEIYIDQISKIKIRRNNSIKKFV